MPVMSVAKFERFFPEAGSLDIEKADLKRYDDFINEKIYHLGEPLERPFARLAHLVVAITWRRIGLERMD